MFSLVSVLSWILSFLFIFSFSVSSRSIKATFAAGESYLLKASRKKGITNLFEDPLYVTRNKTKVCIFYAENMEPWNREPIINVEEFFISPPCVTQEGDHSPRARSLSKWILTFFNFLINSSTFFYWPFCFVMWAALWQKSEARGRSWAVQAHHGLGKLLLRFAHRVGCV